MRKPDDITVGIIVGELLVGGMDSSDRVVFTIHTIQSPCTYVHTMIVYYHVIHLTTEITESMLAIFYFQKPC